MNHGPYGYEKGCRCPVCRAANTAKCAAATRRRRARKTTATFKHGASGYNNWKCRCPVCTTAHSAQNRARSRALLNRNPGNPDTRYRRWTPDEIATVTRTDIPVTHMVTLTGRTYQSILNMRYRMRLDAGEQP